jgi:hypothetical protein
MRRTGCCVLLMVSVGACSHPSSTTYGDTEVGQAIEIAGNVTQADVYQCVDSYAGPKMTKQWSWAGTCNAGTHTGCYRYNFGSGTANQTRVDQRGVFGYQVTFPKYELNLWMALDFSDVGNKQMCVAGGAHVARNPISMTWSGPTGSKTRKNNYIAAGNAPITVEGVRAHNIHDPFYTGRLNLRHSWISWTRDDFVEADFLDIKIIDTLVDGTYAFMSVRDRGCPDGNGFAGNTVVIENSLIRIQRQPGADHASSNGNNPLLYHWDMRGGTGILWKGSGCPWSKWPKFELRNNIFLIEPRMNRRGSYAIDVTGSERALPSAVGTNLNRVSKCENNLFLYTNYSEWRRAGQQIGAVPEKGGRFHNSSNPQFKRNGSDCYQRVTDDPSDPGYGDVMGIWNAEREQWIARHTGSSDPKQNVMQIPGVDYSVLQAGQNYQIRNKSTGQCIQHGASGTDVMLAACNSSAAQLWVGEVRSDGKLRGALLLRNKKSGGYLRSQDPAAIHNTTGANNSSKYDPDVFWVSNSTPNFKERWYIYPLGGEPGGEANTYAIESDALRRTYLMSNGSKVQVQLLYVDGENTASPHPSPFLSGGDNPKLQWYVEAR